MAGLASSAACKKGDGSAALGIAAGLGGSVGLGTAAPASEAGDPRDPGAVFTGASLSTTPRAARTLAPMPRGQCAPGTNSPRSKLASSACCSGADPAQSGEVGPPRRGPGGGCPGGAGACQGGGGGVPGEPVVPLLASAGPSRWECAEPSRVEGLAPASSPGGAATRCAVQEDATRRASSAPSPYPAGETAGCRTDGRSVSQLGIRG